MSDKTHWKKVISDPNFLGEADFQEGEEKIATIARVVEKVDIQTARGKEKKTVVQGKNRVTYNVRPIYIWMVVRINPNKEKQLSAE